MFRKSPWSSLRGTPYKNVSSCLILVKDFEFCPLHYYIDDDNKCNLIVQPDYAARNKYKEIFDSILKEFYVPVSINYQIIFDSYNEMNYFIEDMIAKFNKFIPFM